MYEAPVNIRQVEFTSLDYILQFEEDFELNLAAMLQLRREFRRIVGQVTDGQSKRTRLTHLLSPQGFSDPVARRRYRQPSPGFVLQLHEGVPKSIDAGDELALPVLFLGRARADIELVSKLLTALGSTGFANGCGQFSLLEIRQTARPGSGDLLWKLGEPQFNLSIPYQEIGWWLDQQLCHSPLKLSLLTPTRLLKKNKPLFAVDFPSLFPFALRRVTSMLYAWGDCEAALDVPELLNSAGEVTIIDNALRWVDWRVLEGSPHGQELGGLTGDLWLTGDGLQSVFWVLQLLELFNLGKGAAYGAGQCTVQSATPDLLSANRLTV